MAKNRIKKRVCNQQSISRL